MHGHKHEKCTYIIYPTCGCVCVHSPMIFVLPVKLHLFIAVDFREKELELLLLPLFLLLFLLLVLSSNCTVCFLSCVAAVHACPRCTVPILCNVWKPQIAWAVSCFHFLLLFSHDPAVPVDGCWLFGGEFNIEKNANWFFNFSAERNKNYILKQIQWRRVNYKC